MTWLETARAFRRFLRSRGWTCIFIVRGNKLMVVGMAGPRMTDLRSDNDNGTQ